VPQDSDETQPSPDSALEGWKQIAAYLKCGERTAQRWEKKGLPVRRHEALGIVRALTSDLDAWKELADNAGICSTVNPLRASRPIQAERRILVGRNEQIKSLRDHLSLAVSGSGHMVCVIAEPGIGKTALVESFLHRARSETGILTAAGRCRQELEHSEPYLPWLECLDELAATDKSVDTLLQTNAPTWWNQLRLHRPVANLKEAPTVKREFLRFLQELTDRTPAVLFLDDLHWADLSTVDFLGYLGSSLPSMRLLLVAAYRASDMAIQKNPFLKIEPELKMHRRCEDLYLAELGLQDTQCYLDLRFPGHAFSAQAARWLHERSGGSPLCLTDILEYAVSKEWISFDHGQWRHYEDLPNHLLELPQSVRSLIAKKIGELSQHDLDLLQASSVQGAEFDSTSVATALSLDAAQVEDHLTSLQKTHLLLDAVGQVMLADGRETRRYRFAHVLYRETLLDALGPARRAALSQSLANAIIAIHETGGRSMAPNVARLLEDAGANERALHYYVLAIKNAICLSAHHQAFELAQRAGKIALRCHRDRTTARLEMELLMLRACAAAALGGWEAQDIPKIYRRARGVARQLGDSISLSTVGYLHWDFVSVSNHKRGHGVAASILKRSMMSASKGCRVLPFTAMGIAQLHLGRPMDAVSALEDANAYCSANGRTFDNAYPMHPRVPVLCNLARALWFAGRPAQAVERASEAVEFARGLGNERAIVYAMAIAADISHWQRDTASTLEWSENAANRARRFELFYELIWASFLRAWAFSEMNEPERALAIFEQFIPRYSGPATTEWRTDYAQALGKIGRTSDALKALEGAHQFRTEHDEHYIYSEMLRQRGELLLRTDSVDCAHQSEALTCFKKAVAVSRNQRAKGCELRAATSLLRFAMAHRPQEIAGARQALDAVYATFQDGTLNADLLDAQKLLAS